MPLLSKASAVSDAILGGPQIHTREKSIVELSLTTRFVKKSLVNSIFPASFERPLSLLLTLSTALNLEELELR